MILLYIHHTFEMKFKLRGYLLFQSCQEGGVRLPVQRADQLRDAQEEADPLRDEHAHSRPLSAAERPRHQEVLHKNIKRYAYCFSISLSHYFFPSTKIVKLRQGLARDGPHGERPQSLKPGEVGGGKGCNYRSPLG